MKNRQVDIKVICHMKDIKELEKQVSIIHAEAITKHLNKMNISDNDKKRLIDDVI